MNDDSLKKFNRIIAILTRLQSGKVVKAQELSDRFDVSLRTIYRDMRALESAGVPLIGEAGTGYSLVEGYRLPPIMFSREEALSFVTAEKLMAKFTDKSTGLHYESAIAKVKSVLKTHEKEWLARVESQIDVRPAQRLFNSEIPDSFTIVLESIASKKQVILQYQGVYAPVTHRTIEPVGIFHEYNYWYIMGYCLLRKAYRQFRTDRIVGISRTETKFTQSHGELGDHRGWHDGRPKVMARILVDQQVASYLANSKLAFGFVSEQHTARGLEMSFMTTEIHEGFPRWLMMFADHIQILEPKELEDNMKNLVVQIQERLARGSA